MATAAAYLGQSVNRLIVYAIRRYINKYIIVL